MLRRPEPTRSRSPLPAALAVTLTAALVSSGAALAVPPTETDPIAIMKAVEGRELGDKMTARLTMTIKDAAGRERVRVVQARAMDFPGGRRSLMLFESPADVRNTGLLSIDYDDGKKSDDQWLYLPSLNKSTRISGSDKSGSFLGSDITFADMTQKDTADYDYSLVEAQAKVDGEDCWLIEARPKTQKERDETGYLKTHVWISKAKLIPLQMKAWITAGKKIKQMKFAEVERIDGIWTARKLMVRTLDANDKVESTTVLTWANLKFNDASVSADDFTERRLEEGL